MTRSTQKKYSIKALEKRVLKPIETERDHEEALEMIQHFWGAKFGTRRAYLLQLLFAQAEEHDKKHYPVPPLTAIEAIKFRMKEFGLSVTDLGRIIKHKSRASEILNGKRQPTLEQIIKIHKELNIPTDTLVLYDYKRHRSLLSNLAHSYQKVRD